MSRDMQEATKECESFRDLGWRSWGPMLTGFYMPLGKADVACHRGDESCTEWDAQSDDDDDDKFCTYRTL